ncbi:MAG: outer membrane lipoprotein-sorting protein [Elusimicrobiota bacterium]
MNKLTRIIAYTALAVGFILATGESIAYSQELSAEEIIERLDQNEHFSSARLKSEMVIRDRGREIVKEMETYIKTENRRSDALSEFLNPRDRGTKYLKLGDDMWMYFPDAEDLIHISGHMLRQGMMGSDFSYEDILESEQMTALYSFEFEGEEDINGRPAYILNGIAREDEEPSYHKRRLWVDRERFITLKEQLFSAGGRLLKELRTVEAGQFNGRWIPVEQVMNDKLREETSTTFRIIEIELDYNIPEGKISLDTLQ